MSMSIAIPGAAGPAKHAGTYGSPDSLQFATPTTESPISASQPEHTPAPRRSAQDKGKSKGPGASASALERRNSWMSPAIAASTYTVVNVGQADGVTRLITCIKASQGFEWDQDIFLPGYLRRGKMMEERKEVQEIWVSEEEGRDMFPE